MIKTLWDAGKAKRMESALATEAGDMAAAIVERIRATLAANPDIGVLIRDGNYVYYTSRDGLYMESTDPANLIDEGGA